MDHSVAAKGNQGVDPVIDGLPRERLGIFDIPPDEDRVPQSSLFPLMRSLQDIHDQDAGGGNEHPNAG